MIPEILLYSSVHGTEERRDTLHRGETSIHIRVKTRGLDILERPHPHRHHFTIPALDTYCDKRLSFSWNTPAGAPLTGFGELLLSCQMKCPRHSRTTLRMVHGLLKVKQSSDSPLGNSSSGPSESRLNAQQETATAPSIWL